MQANRNPNVDYFSTFVGGSSHIHDTQFVSKTGRGVRFRRWKPADEDLPGPDFVAVAGRFDDIRARISPR